MTRLQGEQLIREGRGTQYDPFVVDAFLKILDQLEAMDAAEQALSAQSTPTLGLTTTQLEVISATSAEEREFRELSRDLPKAESLADAADVLFRHISKVMPAASLALYLPRPDGSVLDVVACAGAGAATLQALTVPIGERISGWILVHRQAVVNSDATLELGPVAKTFPVPLRYTLAVPVLRGQKAVAVIATFGSGPFESDHQRLLETAATLFHSSVSLSSPSEGRNQVSSDAEKPRTKIH
jgi:signal transduction protein with GAF and PtsI domain